MAITQKSIKILWSASGGRCAFPGCWARLCYHEADGFAPYALGEMAHICGDKPGANRHDAGQSDAQRDDYQNLVLLCPTHHAEIDRKENEQVYTVDMLIEMRAEHEGRVLQRLDQDAQRNASDVARSIVPLLEENRQSWAQYGPASELAQTQPHNEAAHAVWLSEKMSIIVPNNRRVATQLKAEMERFDKYQQQVVSTFLLHVRSFESWVDDAIPYAAVKRFPLEFDELMRGLADAGA